MKLLALLLVAVLPFTGITAEHSAEFYVTNVASLIDPLKLATLGKRAANPRVQKAVAMLETSRRDGYRVAVIVSNAVFVAGYTNAFVAESTREALSRNHAYARKLGVLSTGLADMRRGQSPTIKRGTYAGQELSVDHLIPYTVAPELDNVICNLELMPQRRNESKGDKIIERARVMALDLHKAGLITQARLDEILKR